MTLQRTDFARDAHRRFVERVAASKEVWGLKSEAGWAASGSNHDEDRSVIAFWSDAAYARRCAKGSWFDYVPTPIPLDKFLELWLPGMDRDGTLAGTNWDQNRCGMEIYPLSLKEQIEEAIARRPKE